MNNILLWLIKREVLSLKSSKVFLMGEVLTRKPLNTEILKWQMRNLWRPRANVLILELEDDRFAFGFHTQQERTMF
ncbi:hypothetical protein C1H46_045005 [Malus baccata]|uniref:DUF4283 domain-containing protein n=1 Tax=Malus baccata TaxID=106549 RepID=A0A540K6E4_MALBA|nr:hypothetical protein C1H46_045005 [Malus baccata]